MTEFQAIFGTMVVKNPSERREMFLGGQAWILMLDKIKFTFLQRLVEVLTADVVS